MHPDLDLHGVLQKAYQQDRRREAERARIIQQAARDRVVRPQAKGAAADLRRRLRSLRLLAPLDTSEVS